MGKRLDEMNLPDDELPGDDYSELDRQEFEERRRRGVMIDRWFDVDDLEDDPRFGRFCNILRSL